MEFDLRLGDCLDVMGELEDGSIDLILADLPYGTTACKWDVVIPFEPLWAHYRRLLKPRGAVVLTASQPFTSMLVMSNRKWFRYDWAWDKGSATGYLNAHKMPMRSHESILVFYHHMPTYNPQPTERSPDSHGKGDPSGWVKSRIRKRPLVNRGVVHPVPGSGPSQKMALPQSILRVGTGNGWARKSNTHPTQKPVALMEYLVRTYTNEGDTVLDNVMGSGTTGVACLNTGRNFIGVESDPAYFTVAERRIAAARAKHPLFPCLS